MKFKVSMKNQYFADAKYFFKKSTPMITQSASKDEIIGAMLFFALGIERLLKSILWEINPIFVFTDQSFKNMAPALYSDKLLPSHKQNKEFSKKPNADVLTFKRSLLRAKEFSTATNKHLNVLFALSNYRDNIAHLPLEKIDLEKAKKLYKEASFIYNNLDNSSSKNSEHLILINNAIIRVEGNLENKIKAKSQLP